MRKLNIIHIIGAMPVGGVERNLLRILPMLDREKFNVKMVCIRELGELAGPLEKAGIPVTLKYMKTRYSPSSLWRLAKYLKEEHADIVHCHMRRANTSGRLAAMIAGVPIRLAHERDQGLGKNRRHYIIDRIFAKFNGPVLSVTQGCVDYNVERSGISADRFIVHYNGLEVDKFLEQRDKAVERKKYGIPLDKKIIGCIGRLHKIKDVPLLIDAFAEIYKDRKDVFLLIVGEGKEEDALRNQVKALKLEDSTIFLPWQHDLPSIYAALDVFVLTSRSEGIANVQLECCAAGTPLVSTRVGIAAEAYSEGVHYLPVESNVESVKQAILQALEKETADKLIANGHEIIKKFTLEKQKENLEKIYLDLWQKYQQKGHV